MEPLPSSLRHSRPDPQTSAAVQRSCLLLRDRPDHFANAFRVQVGADLVLGPLVGPQAAELALEMAMAIVDSLTSGVEPGAMESDWEGLGAHYAAQEAAQDIFTSVFQVLMRTSRELSDDNWSTALGSSWAAVWLWVIAHLEAGANHARLLGSPVHPQVAALTRSAPAPDPQTDAGSDRPDKSDRRRRQRTEAIDDLWL